ncbi:hypothetical protein [Rhodoferax sp. BLA1]|uniref:hypothetical protein n=1 Tax=Rhodoferax sp. BLA1 TaxID=2576062 RepID=UPI0015D148C7|nr:hypothetical protein [Rhodoferax sp. BLA1]
MSMTQEHLDLAMKAVAHVIKRMQSDPRLAYLMGPGTEAFDLLIAAAAAPSGLDEDFLGEQITGTLAPQPVAAIGVAAAEVDQELLARIALYDDGVHDRDNQNDLNMLVNHFVRRGLEVAEAERDTITKEIF